MTFCFCYRSDVRDRNSENSRPESEPDGLLRHHSTDRLLQWHSEHPAVGSWTFPGQKVKNFANKKAFNQKIAQERCTNHEGVDHLSVQYIDNAKYCI